MCKRVDARIECTTCGYPYSEAMYGLHEVMDPGCEREIAKDTVFLCVAVSLFVLASFAAYAITSTLC